ncbi:dihydrolipoamide dehydrogenase [Friedmanniella endophytica]|uniref:NAD(P)H dehydrogenase (quinone) n=1 Tax=Microlunatus kandeliicorticis TaxID=1759536 RepID=A0A7W3IQF9_9ACTN|nr:NAD(P)H-quinone dehydrogenase [Microlunatus kandeliicorticis]MBA8793315.1 dihydrolipoamide dehydrogenase [Microlunatus kandeliicorticis]
MTRVVIVGGGPGGYEAALVGSQLGGDVTLVDTDGLGGSAVLTDCVPSKTLIATAEVMTEVKASTELGLRFGRHGEDTVEGQVNVDLAMVNQRVKRLAQAQSADIVDRIRREGIRVVTGRGRLDGPERVVAETADGEQSFDADVVLIATGAHPRVLPDAVPDGERILTWTQVYELTELPERLIVVGSGVTGAEFASAYDALGVDVVLVSSRDRVLPGEDADAARVLEDVFTRRGMTVLSRSRAAGVVRDGDQVTVTLTDGRIVTGSHCLLAVGSIPNTADMGLDTARVDVDRGGFVTVDRVSRTSARGVYAAGDCTGVMMLASVAAMQGRIAMWHALGDAVSPLDLRSVSSNVFTSPEIATVGATQEQVDNGEVRAIKVSLPLRGNARAKMQGIRDGFVKLFCLPATGIIVGGVVVAPRASELIHAVSVAVAERITVDQLAADFTVYPSLSGSVAEAARRLHGHSVAQLVT